MPLLVKRGDRIAQLVLERIVTPDVVEVEVRIPETDGITQVRAYSPSLLQDLDDTTRGAGGFGSTGRA